MSQKLYGPSGGKLGLMNGQTMKQAFIPLMGGAQAVYNSSGLAFYRHSDWLGTVRLDTTPTRTVYFDGAWAPFGEYYQGTGTSDRVFTGQTQDVAGGIYDFLFRQYNSSQGRWIAPDPAGMAAVDITNPQTWNRYAYVTNDPCSLIDPLGLDSDTCHFNVLLKNSAGLGSQQLSDITARINEIFGATKGTNGESVGIDFVTSGTSDATLNFTTSGTIAAIGSWFGYVINGLTPPLSTSSDVYTNLVTNGFERGNTSAHELGHSLGQSLPLDQFDDPGYAYPPNIMMSGHLTPDQYSATDHDPHAQLWSFSPQQISALYKKCKQRRLKDPEPTTFQHGGGGGSGLWGWPSNLLPPAPPPVW